MRIKMLTFNNFKVKPISGAMGAEISDIDLSGEIDSETWIEIQDYMDECVDEIPKKIFLQIMAPAQCQHMDYPKPAPMHIQYSWQDSTQILKLIPVLQASLKLI